MWVMTFDYKWRVLLSHFVIFLLIGVGADTSPQVADVEDLFKDEGFLRMSRGGEAFGGRRPPPPLIITPPHISTPAPIRHFIPEKKEVKKPPVPPPSLPDDSKKDEKISLEKDESLVFSRVESDTDPHPLLGITPAAPGDPFDFNPILSNPAVTRILAGSSGRIPQWEPTLPHLHEISPPENFAPPDRNRGINNNLHSSLPSSNPIFSPDYGPKVKNSPSSSTMLNMDQLTNNIAIPKQALPNPSNLATSRSVPIYPPDENLSFSGYNSEKDRSGEEGDNLNNEDRDEEEEGEGKNRNELLNLDTNLDELGGRGYKCVALCGAWRHQCKLMGIVFCITSGLCILFSILLLYSLHYSLKDFMPFSIIILILFTISSTRAFLLLSSPSLANNPENRPQWQPILATLPPTLFTIAILIFLKLAQFPFPFLAEKILSGRLLGIISSFIFLPQIALSISATLHPLAPIFSTLWIFTHGALGVVALLYLGRFKHFYAKVGNGGSRGSYSAGREGEKEKREFCVKWGCLEARAMFGVSLVVLTLSSLIIISVAMGRGEVESSLSWAGWALSLCARILEFIIVILLLVLTFSSGDIKFLRLTRAPINKSNVGLMNSDIFPTMVSSNTAVQRCIPTYNTNTRADVMMLAPTENRSSLRGKTFGERALPGEKLGEYRSSVGRCLPIRLNGGNGGECFPEGMRLPEPAPASLLVTKVLFGTPAISREVHLTATHHPMEAPLLSTRSSKDGGTMSERETSSNIYASLESVKVAPPHPTSSNGSNHSGSDRVLLSAQRDYIYSISRDLTKTIDAIYDTSRPRSSIQQTIDGISSPPLAHTIEQMGSIPNLVNRSHYSLHHPPPSSLGFKLGRDRNGYGPPPPPPPSLLSPRNFILQLNPQNSHQHQNSHPNSLQNSLQNSHQHNQNMHNNSQVSSPPPYSPSDSSHDVTPDSGIVSDLASSKQMGERGYGREYRRPSSVEDMRRLHKQRANGVYERNGTIYEQTPPSSTSIVGRVEHLLNQTEHLLSSTDSNRQCVENGNNRHCVENGLNRQCVENSNNRQCVENGNNRHCVENGLNRQSIDNSINRQCVDSSISQQCLDNGNNRQFADNSLHRQCVENDTHRHCVENGPNRQNVDNSPTNRFLSHKEQLEHVEKLIAQAEYAIWVEKRNCAQQSGENSYGYGSVEDSEGKNNYSSQNYHLGPNRQLPSLPVHKKIQGKKLEEESVV